MENSQNRAKEKLKNNRGLILFIILILTFTAFSSSLNNDYTNWDDESHFLKNPDVLLLNVPHLRDIFINTVNQTYNPLTTLSFAIEHHFFRFNPFVSHLINCLFHLGITALVFLFALRLNLGIYTAGFSALLFGIHPMHVESVAWVTQRKDVLYAFFYMLALNSYIQYTNTFKKTSYLLSIVYGLFSILAKPMALSLPLILFVCDWFQRRRFDVKVCLEKIPYFLIIIPVASISYVLNARTINVEFWSAFIVWFWSLAFYIQKFIFPLNL